MSGMPIPTAFDIGCEIAKESGAFHISHVALNDALNLEMACCYD
jgi:hypothetical protein